MTAGPLFPLLHVAIAINSLGITLLIAHAPLPNRHVFGEQPTKVSIFRTFVGVSRSLVHMCASSVTSRRRSIDVSTEFSRTP